MIKYSRQKIYFVIDGYLVYKIKKLNEWFEVNKERIEVFFFLLYSFELNLQEYVNQDVKINVIGKKCFINKVQMCNNVEDFMNKRKNDKRQV